MTVKTEVEDDMREFSLPAVLCFPAKIDRKKNVSQRSRHIFAYTRNLREIPGFGFSFAVELG